MGTLSGGVVSSSDLRTQGVLVCSACEEHLFGGSRKISACPRCCRALAIFVRNGGNAGRKGSYRIKTYLRYAVTVLTLRAVGENKTFWKQRVQSRKAGESGPYVIAVKRNAD